MSYLYVCEQGATIGITENRFQVKYKDGMVKSIPAETLEVIEIFGKIQITTQCITECLKRGVNILFYSTKGAYFGRLISTNHVNSVTLCCGNIVICPDKYLSGMYKSG